MIELSEKFIKDVIAEIEDPSEVNRRAMAKRRHDIYADGGKNYLMEQLTREFNRDSIKEMRLTPINFLQKIVNTLGSVYKRSPTRKALLPSDQALVDYYEGFLSVNALMQKANRYLVLAANTVVYTRPWMKKDGTWCVRSQVIPNYLYSISPNPMDKTQIGSIIFSAFVQAGRVTPQTDQISATGAEGYSKLAEDKIEPDLVASLEKDTALSPEQYIFWTDEHHVTTNGNGDVFRVAGQDEDQFLNPIEMLPIVNIARDRDNEPWSTQGEDTVDLAIALQLGWSDALTVAKQQGYGIPVVISEEEPKKLTIGLNRMLWLRANPNGPAPSFQFVSPNAPIAQQVDMLEKLTNLMLTTKNLNPKSIGGTAGSTSDTSGFQALLSMSDALEYIESDKAVMRQAEEEYWPQVARWHNWLMDQGLINPDAAALGRFSEEMQLGRGLNITYPDVKPLESDDEKLTRIERMDKLGLITRKQALKKLNPDASDEEIDQMLKEIDDEKSERMARAQEMISNGQTRPDAQQNQDNQEAQQDDSEDQSPEEGL